MRLRASGPGKGMYILFSNLSISKFNSSAHARSAQNPPAFDSVIQLPRDVRRTQNQDACVVMAYAVHLDQELGLDSP